MNITDFPEGVLYAIVFSVLIILVLICVPSIVRAVNSKSIDNPNDKNECRIIQIKFRFIIGILIGLIVLLFSFSCYRCVEWFDFMSFASAIISIILAIITIIYTLYTSNHSEDQIQRLNDAAEAVRKATDDTQKSTKIYEQSATNLDDNIQLILERIEKVEKNTGAYDQLLRDVSEIHAENSSNPESASKKGGVKTTVSLNSFSSFAKCCLYACIKAKKAHKDLDFSVFGDIKGQYYCYGFLIALRATTLVSVTSKSSPETIAFTIDKIAPEIENKSEPLREYIMSKKTPSLIEVVNRIDANYSDKE